MLCTTECESFLFEDRNFVIVWASNPGNAKKLAGCRSDVCDSVVDDVKSYDVR